MRSNIISITASALCVVSVVQGAAFCRPGCKATSYWPGWGGIKHIFSFGDSYTSTSFNTSGTPPSLDNPLGNPPFPGYTAADGPNWIDQLTVKYNATKTLTYNLAYGGATINSALVAPYLPIVSSVAEQIENEWFPRYAGKEVPWASEDTLFTVFDGINDVGNSFYKGLPATTILNKSIFDVYHGLIMELYYAGARNFAFLNVPPVDRSPLAMLNTAAEQAEEKADIAAWNAQLLVMAGYIKDEKPDVNIFTVDTNKYFTEALDKPSSFPQTAQYKNTTAYCVAYENGTPTETYLDPSCGIPVQEYFWLNSLHPTYPMQDVLAEEVAKRLIDGPNVC